MHYNIHDNISCYSFMNAKVQSTNVIHTFVPINYFGYRFIIKYL